MKYRVAHVVILAVTLLAAIPVVAQPSTHDQVRLLFTGDILLSREVEVELKHRGRSPWINFQELFHGVEWVGGNLEGAVGPASDCVSQKSPCFAISDSDVALLKEAGFRALTVENNHAGDLGVAGRTRTLQVLQQSGLLAADFENSPQLIQIGKWKIAMVAITTIPAADGRVQQVPSKAVLEKLRQARLRANVVVVSIHWGNELVPWPNDAQRKQAAWLVAHGADLVLGHHPHVIQSPECIAGRPVFFSLGNHVFDQANPRTKDGLIADCRLGGDRLHCQAIRTHTGSGTSVPRLSGRDHSVNSVLTGCDPTIREVFGN